LENKRQEFAEQLTPLQLSHLEVCITTPNQGPGVVEHTYKPSYLIEGRERRITVQGQSGQKISETLSQRTSWVWWLVPVTLAVQEAQIGGPGAQDPI
jgi:hypothetical protein